MNGVLNKAAMVKEKLLRLRPGTGTTEEQFDEQQDKFFDTLVRGSLESAEPPKRGGKSVILNTHGVEGAPAGRVAEVLNEESSKRRSTRSASPARTLTLDALFEASGEKFEPIEEATKFTFDPDTGKWGVDKITVRVAADWFSQGGMRSTYRAAVIDSVSPPAITPCVVKIFKNHEKIPATTVFNEGLTQGVAQSFAVHFNKLCVEKLGADFTPIEFVPTEILLLHTRTPRVYATMERFIRGKYIKYNDNLGRRLKDEMGDLAQTFGYYSYVASNRSLVVVDVQGVGRQFTDPQIHSVDGQLFGGGNLGIDGITKFLSTYVTTPMHVALNLDASPGTSPEELLKLKADLEDIKNRMVRVRSFLEEDDEDAYAEEDDNTSTKTGTDLTSPFTLREGNASKAGLNTGDLLKEEEQRMLEEMAKPSSVAGGPGKPDPEDPLRGLTRLSLAAREHVRSLDLCL